MKKLFLLVGVLSVSTIYAEFFSANLGLNLRSASGIDFTIGVNNESDEDIAVTIHYLLQSAKKVVTAHTKKDVSTNIVKSSLISSDAYLKLRYITFRIIGGPYAGAGGRWEMLVPPFVLSQDMIPDGYSLNITVENGLPKVTGVWVRTISDGIINAQIQQPAISWRMSHSSSDKRLAQGKADEAS